MHPTIAGDVMTKNSNVVTASGKRARRATIVASLVAAFALVASVSLAGAAAPAQAAYLKSTDAVADHHLNILRWPPRNPGFRPCINGSTRLFAGDFLHGAYAVSETHRTDPDLYQAQIRVRVAGNYSWEACRGWNSRIDRYQIRSTLRGRGFSHTILNTFEPDPNQLSRPSHLYGNGNYEWGGRIVHYVPGLTEPSG
jgi:hypothetical protein